MQTHSWSTAVRRVVVLNPKGGSGKTTLAFNLAGYLASTGRRVALVDMDRQGSSTRWLQNRPDNLPVIDGLSPCHSGHRAEPKSLALPPHVDVAVIDAPAGLDGEALADYTCGAHAVLVPVLPSDLDIHAASRLISELLLVAQMSRRNGRLGIVANRVRERTVANQQLQRFLARLSIAVVGVLRDSQNYTWAAAGGLCLHEMPKGRVGKDLEQWQAIATWVDERLARPLDARDLRRPTPIGKARRPRAAWLAAAAAAAIAIAAAWRLPAPAPVETLAEPSAAAWRAPEFGLLAVPPAAPDQPAKSAPAPASAPASADAGEVRPSGEKMQQKWQLDGVVKSGGDSTLILRDRNGNGTRHLSQGDELDGWVVAGAGMDYAILSQDEQEIRLELIALDAP